MCLICIKKKLVGPASFPKTMKDKLKFWRRYFFFVFYYNLFQPKKLTLNAGMNSVVLDEKLQTRKERFGL